MVSPSSCNSTRAWFHPQAAVPQSPESHKLCPFVLFPSETQYSSGLSPSIWVRVRGCCMFTETVITQINQPAVWLNTSPSNLTLPSHVSRQPLLQRKKDYLLINFLLSRREFVKITGFNKVCS